MTLKEQIMKLQTYKMYEGEDTVYVERDDVLKALEQQPNRCDSCVHSEEQDGSNCYECVKGMTDNFETQPTDADCISREATKEMLIEEWTKHIPMELDINLSFVLEKISELPSVTPKSENSWKEIKIKFECDDCISKQAVLDLTGKSDWFESSDDYNDFFCAVCNLPSVTPTRPKGKWIIRPDRASDIEYRCSECGKIQFADDTNELNYCCNCGSKMEVEE